MARGFRRLSSQVQGHMSGIPDENEHRRSLILRLAQMESSLCLVPKEPLPHQCAAGARVGNMSVEQARTIYCAMLAADEQDPDLRSPPRAAPVPGPIK